MLFPFDPPRRATFHMAGVSFPIDIVFVDAKHGSIARIAHEVPPGATSNWTHSPCSAVVEVPGGFCRRHRITVGDAFDSDFVKGAALEAYNAPLSKVEPGSHGPAGHNRFEDRDDPTKSNPNARDNPIDGYEEVFGFDPTTEDNRTENAPALYRPSASRATRVTAQDLNAAELPSGEIVDPVAFALGAIKALGDAAASGDSLQWKSDPLNPSEEYAIVTKDTIKGWLGHIGIGDIQSVVSAATSAEGMDTIAESLVLAEVATRTRYSPDGTKLILYRQNAIS